MKYPVRAIARIVLTAETPWRIGAGKKGLDSDSTIRLDANGLPYIPGSSLAGVLRQRMDENTADQVFGAPQHGNKPSHGSELIVSDACLVYEGRHVAEGIVQNLSKLLEAYRYELPIRQHVRIGHKGAAEKGGKFDEQVVFAGSRFCFELELLSAEPDKGTRIRELLSYLGEKCFRIGSGSRKGLGAVSVTSAKWTELELSNPEDLDLYLKRTSSLEDNTLDKRWKDYTCTSSDAAGWKSVDLELIPQDFVLFSSGVGDSKADITPVYETVIEWSGNDPEIKKRRTVFPASSVKGALAHRVAFHYNRFEKRFADQCPDLKSIVGDKNEAVQALFGYSGSFEERGCRGSVLFSDVFVDAREKTFDHVVIDSYTGGSLDGGLFKEKVSQPEKAQPVKLRLLVFEDAFGGEHGENVKKAFFAALNDLCNGSLPLGGATNRGYGVFKGKIIDDNGKS